MNIPSKLVPFFTAIVGLITFFVVLNFMNFTISYTVNISLKEVLNTGWVAFNWVVTLVITLVSLISFYEYFEANSK